MPRTKGQNKSAAIREVLQANPSLSANEVVATLKEKGVTIRPNLVYSLKGQMKAEAKRRKKVVKAARAAAVSSNGASGDPIALIRDVRSLATRAGGYEKLKELVDALAE